MTSHILSQLFFMAAGLIAIVVIVTAFITFEHDQ